MCDLSAACYQHCYHVRVCIERKRWCFRKQTSCSFIDGRICERRRLQFGPLRCLSFAKSTPIIPSTTKFDGRWSIAPIQQAAINEPITARRSEWRWVFIAWVEYCADAERCIILNATSRGTIRTSGNVREFSSALVVVVECGCEFRNAQFPECGKYGR